MSLTLGIHFVVMLVVAILLARELLWRSNRGASTQGRGIRVEWRLDSKRKTEIISNKALGAVQAHRDDGGLLTNGDQVVVWAREFLDDDILYKNVSRNITKGIVYLYILDRTHTERFQRLLHRLYNDIPERRTVDEAINIIFVRQELTLNNFVVLGYGSERQCAYSALIYDDRPFGWLRQDSSRAQIIVSRVKTIVASVALAQAGQLDPRSLDYVVTSDQIMDFRKLGQNLGVQGDHSPETARFSLKEVVAEVDIPPDSEEKVIQLAERRPALRGEG